MLAVKGTTIKDGKVTLKRSYSFIQLSPNRVAVAKIVKPPAGRRGGVSPRAHNVEIFGTFSCSCSRWRGACNVKVTVEPDTNSSVLSCEGVGRCSRRGCDLEVDLVTS